MQVISDHITTMNGISVRKVLYYSCDSNIYNQLRRDGPVGYLYLTLLQFYRFRNNLFDVRERALHALDDIALRLGSEHPHHSGTSVPTLTNRRKTPVMGPVHSIGSNIQLQKPHQTQTDDYRCPKPNPDAKE